MPPLEAFPRSHIVTFKYYVGVIFFLEEDYKQVCPPSPHNYRCLTPNNMTKAEENLTEAYKLCLASSHRNRESVLYLFSYVSYQPHFESPYYL